jgi:hypothetical protein
LNLGSRSTSDGSCTLGGFREDFLETIADQNDPIAGLVVTAGHPWLVVSAAAYAPVSNLHPLERFTADSYFYLPWLGLVACLARTWPTIEEFVARRGDGRLRVLRGFVVVICVAWGGLTAIASALTR